MINVLGFVVGLLLLPLWMMSLLNHQREAGQAFRAMLPGRLQADILAIVRILDRVLSAFLRGRLLLGVAVGAILYALIALVEPLGILHVQYKLLAAIFAGLLQLIPQVGPLIGTVLFGVFGLSASTQAALLIVGCYASAQLIVSNLIAPRVERRLNDLNPAILVMFLAALSQFGLAWALISARTGDHSRPGALRVWSPGRSSTACRSPSGRDAAAESPCRRPHGRAARRS